MSNPRIKHHAKRYAPYWSEYSKELRRGARCQECGSADRLTVAHLDQEPSNNEPKNLKILCRSCHIQMDQPYHVFSAMTAKKTDNSYQREKIQLRLESLKLIKTDPITILEAFAGDGVIWGRVQELTTRRLEILRIDQKDGKKGVYLKGDNMKFISMFNFSRFDIIDLDAHGSPYNQLKVVFLKHFTGVVHCTFVETFVGVLHREMLRELGYPREMVKKCPTLFYRQGWEKFTQYLALHGVNQIHYHNPAEKKYYFYFTLKQSTK